MLARCYAVGKLGFRNDQQLAFKWFMKAANEDQPYAMLEVAKCYELGIGTKKNIAKAIEYYEYAEIFELPGAKEALKRLKK